MTAAGTAFGITTAVAPRPRMIHALWLALVVLVPFLFGIHGVLWAAYGINSALLIYLVKISGLIYLAAFFVQYRPTVLLRRSIGIVLVVSVVLIVTGLLAPLGNLSETSPFYYIADLIGTSSTILYILVTYFLLRRGVVTAEQVYRVVELSTLVMCSGIIVNYFATGGQKVSIPSEIHFGIAVTIARWITKEGKHSMGSNAAMAVVFVGALASALRINYLIAGLSILLSYGWLVMRRPTRRSIVRMSMVLALVLVAGFVFRATVLDRFLSVSLQQNVDIGAGAVLTDPSAEQRFVEGILVVREVTTHPGSLAFGKGFGATYENYYNLIPHYDARMHHVHNSVLTILLRNGVFGALVIFCIPLFLMRDMLLGSRDLFVAAHGLLMTYGALMTDQYLYWGLLFGLSFALWWHARKRPPA